MKETGQFRFFLIVFLIFFALSAAGSLLSLYVDGLWFRSLNYSFVFYTILRTKAALWFLFSLGFFLWGYAHVALAKRFSPRIRLLFEHETIEIPKRGGQGHFMELAFWPALLFFSFAAGESGSGAWETFLKYQHSSSFHLTDPVFGRDISFYVFSLPFYGVLLRYTFFAVLFSFAAITAYYVLSGEIFFARFRIQSTSLIKSHLSFHLVLFFSLLGILFKLVPYRLLLQRKTLLVGAGFTDVHVVLPVISVLSVLCFVCAAMSLLYMFSRSLSSMLISVFSLLALVLFWFLGVVFIPSLVQKFVVAPNELEKERPYLSHHIRFTRYAYGLEKLSEKEFFPEGEFTRKTLSRSELTLKNIRLWDHRPLLSTYRQLQEIRTYYAFYDVDVDRYHIGNEYRQVMLSAREMDTGKLPSRMWINEHLTYTHGYGAVVSPVNRISQEGLPEFFVKDIPPKGAKELFVQQPQIYFGEGADRYVVVNTKARELDYPSGDKNVFTRYEGRAGVPAGGYLRKLLLAFFFRELKILFSQDITASSRFLFYRNILVRLEKIAPFLSFDQDPYLVIASGKLFWIVDAYTATKRFPYSSFLRGELNYIRNSVKAVVDAYDGTATFYVSAPDDPLVQTYMKIFPGLFQPLSDMPPDIAAHIRYPERLFLIQAEMLRTYHMKDPGVFYNKEDLWDVPTELFGSEEVSMEAYYTILKLPGEQKEEFVLMLPFTPSKKNNLSAWLCARSDKLHYGELLLFKFPKKKLVYGPMQVEARIDQEPEISKQLSLWSQRGSQVIRGNLLVIPLENTLLYVEPVYLQAEQSQIPELKRVVVAHGNRVIMEENLERGLEQLAETALKAEKPVQGQTKEKTMPGEEDAHTKQALQEYLSAKKALREENWGAFGDHMKRLEQILKQMQ